MDNDAKSGPQPSRALDKQTQQDTCDARLSLQLVSYFPYKHGVHTPLPKRTTILRETRRSLSGEEQFLYRLIGALLSKLHESLLHCQEEHILILSHQDTALANALQSRAAVVLQKSLREGFGLTVTEAMWAGTPVIGGNVGGIRYQIEDGVNGFLVSSSEEAAERIVRLLTTRERRARETVRERFLLARLLEQYLDLLNAFETNFSLDGNSRAGLG